MTALDNCKKELATLRDAVDKLVSCLQDAAQAENLKEFHAGAECADEMVIILRADLFNLLLKSNLGINAEKEIKEVESIKVEPLKSEVIETLPVEAKSLEVEAPKEEIVEVIKEEPLKVDLPKEEEKVSEL